MPDMATLQQPSLQTWVRKDKAIKNKLNLIEKDEHELIIFIIDIWLVASLNITL